MKTFYLFIVAITLGCSDIYAQYDAPLYTAYTTKKARIETEERIIKNIIIRNLNHPLNEETEENWQDAFTAMEVYQYHSSFAAGRIRMAFDSAVYRSTSFQRALLEVAYTNYPAHFIKEVQFLLEKTVNPRNFAMCAEYLLAGSDQDSMRFHISGIMQQKFKGDIQVHPILSILYRRLHVEKQPLKLPLSEVLSGILQKNFLPGKTVMYSFQRPDRNYPGLTVFRNPQGNFVRDSTGNVVHIPQLARSITNLPFYLRNGNTPQGIYRMYGFGVSMSDFIGPTANIQMGMPWELSKRVFLDDSTILDTTWTIENYRNLLPGKLKNYFPIFGSFYAGMIGRNEIIAHGTTLNPELYANTSYYPLTPTMGCLATREIWDGRRVESDQQMLVNALLKAGGAKGYAVVLEVEDKKEAVSIEEILPFIK